MPTNNETKEATGFVNVVRDIIRQEMADRDTTAVTIVESVNEDGTLNLYVLPDTQSVIRNIVNQCRFNFKKGDTALLYLIGNRLSNSFVIAKYNVSGLSDMIDDYLSDQSKNPVENNVITKALNKKQNILKEGSGIKIENDVVSAYGFKNGNLTLDSSLWDTSNDYEYHLEGMSSSDIVLLKPVDRENQERASLANLFCTPAKNKLLFNAENKPTENIILLYSWKES